MDKYSLKKLTKERLLNIIAGLEWKVEFYEKRSNTDNYFVKETKRLEQELAEKDKEIEMLRETISIIIKDKTNPLSPYHWFEGE